jgi:hypothetical protein
MVKTEEKRSNTLSNFAKCCQQNSLLGRQCSHGFFPTGDNLVRKLKPLSKRVASATHVQLLDRQELLRSSRNLESKDDPLA